MNLRRDLIRSLAREGANMSLVKQEPEVVELQLSSIRCRALAKIIAQLLDDHEPLLTAEADDTIVIVKERGGKAAMRIMIETI